jgi:hypothetical protein
MQIVTNYFAGIRNNFNPVTLANLQFLCITTIEAKFKYASVSIHFADI